MLDGDFFVYQSGMSKAAFEFTFLLIAFVRESNSRERS